MGIGDWGLGIGEWGMGIVPNQQSPISHQLNQNTNKHKIKKTKNK